MRKQKKLRVVDEHSFVIFKGRDSDIIVNSPFKSFKHSFKRSFTSVKVSYPYRYLCQFSPSAVHWVLQDPEKPVKNYVNYKSNRAYNNVTIFSF